MKKILIDNPMQQSPQNTKFVLMSFHNITLGDKYLQPENLFTSTNKIVLSSSILLVQSS